MRPHHNVTALEDLVGEAVDEVCFPADYVELRFGGPILRLLLYPVSVQWSGQEWDFPRPGSRDALCSTIGSTVSGVDRTDTELTVVFSDGASLRARIDEADPRGPESVHFVPWERGRLNVAAMEIL
ncbi:MAG: hypothetical protein JHD16_14555 [Solirubrobacteraceae bacterium]|nr:hypothetical protein [Solirubrobacteraceae bacterium]